MHSFREEALRWTKLKEEQAISNPNPNNTYKQNRFPPPRPLEEVVRRSSFQERQRYAESVYITVSPKNACERKAVSSVRPPSPNLARHQKDRKRGPKSSVSAVAAAPISSTTHQHQATCPTNPINNACAATCSVQSPTFRILLLVRSASVISLENAS